MQPTTELPTSPSLPAWALSLVLHLAGLLVIALLLRTFQPAPAVEPERPVGVVVARQEADQSTEYFTEEDAEQATATATAAASPAAALPAAPELPEALPDIALPGSPESTVDRTDLLPDGGLRPGSRPIVLPGQGDAEILAAEAARRRLPSGPTGPVARMSLFGGPAAEGRRFVFVIDRSKSMGSTGLGALGAAEKELSAAVAKLDSSHKFEIVAYNRKPVYFGDRKWVPATDSNKTKFQAFLAGIAAFGATEHEIALMSALEMKPDVLYLLTDGGDPYLTPGQLQSVTNFARRQGTHIHCIQFGFGAEPQDGNPFMRVLAQQNGGGYAYVNMARQPR